MNLDIRRAIIIALFVAGVLAIEGYVIQKTYEFTNNIEQGIDDIEQTYKRTLKK